jgi:hypothetical protein
VNPYAGTIVRDDLFSLRFLSCVLWIETCSKDGLVQTGYFRPLQKNPELRKIILREKMPAHPDPVEHGTTLWYREIFLRGLLSWTKTYPRFCHELGDSLKTSGSFLFISWRGRGTVSHHDGSPREVPASLGQKFGTGNVPTRWRILINRDLWQKKFSSRKDRCSLSGREITQKNPHFPDYEKPVSPVPIRRKIMPGS